MEIKKTFKKHEKDILLATTIFLVALVSFGLGRLSKIRENKTPIIINTEGVKVNNKMNMGENNIASIGNLANPTPMLPAQGGMLVASKTGTKYHFPWCSGAQRIKEENKVWFTTNKDARQAGYTPASNCKGLE